MAGHIGIVGCSAEGAALCYKTICVEAQEVMGVYHHPEVSLHTQPLQAYMGALEQGDWAAVGRLMAASATKLSQIGADFAICPDNTVHHAYDTAIDQSPIPWLHIADEVGEEAVRKGYRRLGILGTSYTMTGTVYPASLDALDIGYAVPDETARKKVDDIIMKDLINGVFAEPARLYYNKVIQSLKDRGCDAVVLGCTEIPLLVDPNDCPLPCLDSTRLLARAAIRKAGAIA